MRLSKKSFEGLKEVYSFTLRQQIKNKANIVSAVIMLIIALLSVPVASVAMNAEIFSGSSDITTAYILNDTGLELDFSQAQEINAKYSGVEFSSPDFPEDEYVSCLAGTEVLVKLSKDGAGYSLELLRPEDCDVGESDAGSFAALCTEILNRARYNAAGIDSGSMEVLGSGFDTSSGTVEDYYDVGFDARFAVEYIYAIIVMIVSIFSASYIIRSVVEEKASKLVELLMVSVKPLALISGKILAVMTYIFGFLILMLAAFGLSAAVSSVFMDISVISSAISALGINSEMLNIGFGTVIIALMWLVVACLTFAIISGISGASCSVMEDMESANLTTMLPVMAGYIVSCAAAGFSGGWLTVFVSFCPIVAVFCAPVQYVCGNISLWMLLLSWVIQAGVAAALALLCSRVYSGLIMYNGSRVKLSGIFKMAKEAGKNA